MTKPSAKTKADLLEDIGALRSEIARLESIEHYSPPRVVAVPEADALAACIRAFDALTQARQSSSMGGYASIGYGFDPSARHQQSATERVLRALAAKYDVDLIEVRTEPCHRRHVDEINPSQVMNALGVGL